MFTCGPVFFYVQGTSPGPIGGSGPSAPLATLDYALNAEPFVVIKIGITTEEPDNNAEPFFVQGS